MHYFRLIFLLMLLAQMSHTATLNLNDILKRADKQTTLVDALKQQALALEAQNQADTSRDPLELFASGTKVYSVGGGDDYEYGVGVIQKIPLGHIQTQDQSITRLQNEASMLDEQKKVLNLYNGLKNLYHQHCIDVKNYESFDQNYNEFAKLYAKKAKAYEYQEISKAELMQLKIEKNRLYAKLQSMRINQKMSKRKLLLLSGSDKFESIALSCRDMYPIRKQIRARGHAFLLSKEAFHKRTQSTQVALKRHQNQIDSIDVTVQYDKEIDIEKYTVGFSVPLGFTSKKSQEERAAALYRQSAISLHHQQDMLEKKSIAMNLKSQIKRDYFLLQSIEKNVKEYRQELLPLIQKSYSLGESSVVEYLLSRQQFYRLNQSLYQTQKSYYNTLFRLYTVYETKDKK